MPLAVTNYDFSVFLHVSAVVVGRSDRPFRVGDVPGRDEAERPPPALASTVRSSTINQVHGAAARS